MTALVAPAASAATADPSQGSSTNSSLTDVAKKYLGSYNSAYVFDIDSPKVTKSDGTASFDIPEEANNSLLVASDVAQDSGINTTGKLSATDINKLAVEQADAQESSEAMTAKPLATSPWTYFGTPPGGVWAGWTKRRLALIGTANAVQGYQFKVSPGSNTQICGQGTGWIRLLIASKPKPKYQSIQTTYGLGCGSSGSGNVPWQGVSAYPKFRSKSITLTGGTGLFR